MFMRSVDAQETPGIERQKKSQRTILWQPKNFLEQKYYCS